MHADGEIANISIVKSSQYSVMDDAALNAINNSFPFLRLKAI